MPGEARERSSQNRDLRVVEVLVDLAAVLVFRARIGLFPLVRQCRLLRRRPVVDEASKVRNRLDRAGLRGDRKLQPWRAIEEPALEHLHVRHGGRFGASGVAHEHRAGREVVQLLVQAMNRVPGSRGVDDDDERLDAFDDNLLGGPPDDIADVGAYLVHEGRWIDLVRSSEAARCNPHQEVRVTACPAPGLSWVPVGKAKYLLGDIGDSGRRRHVQAHLPVDPYMLVLTRGVADGADESTQLARTQEWCVDVDGESHDVTVAGGLHAFGTRHADCVAPRTFAPPGVATPPGTRTADAAGISP